MTNPSHKSLESPDRIAQDQLPRSLKYYLSGGKNYSIKVGRYATRAYIHAKEFLAKKEVSVPSILNPSENKLGETGAITNIEKHRGRRTDHVPEKTEERDPDSNSYDGDAVNDNDSLVIPDRDEKKQSTVEDIKKITKRSNEILCEARAVFPFSLFPDEVHLDRTKLTITKRDFFFSSKVMSIRIEDVLNVSADVGPFFGSLTVAIRIMSSEDHVTVNYLRRKDTIHLKHMVQGYVIAQHNKIEVAHLSREDLMDTLAELGHDQNA